MCLLGWMMFVGVCYNTTSPVPYLVSWPYLVLNRLLTLFCWICSSNGVQSRGSHNLGQKLWGQTQISHILVFLGWKASLPPSTMVQHCLEGRGRDHNERNEVKEWTRCSVFTGLSRLQLPGALTVPKRRAEWETKSEENVVIPGTHKYLFPSKVMN